jgi:hypothetical protein
MHGGRSLGKGELEAIVCRCNLDDKKESLDSLHIK